MTEVDSDATLSADEADKISVVPNPAKGATDITKETKEPDEPTTTVLPILQNSDVKQSASPSSSDVQCAVCSMLNDPLRLTCAACSHVMDERRDSRHWRCVSEVCKGSTYVNAGDCGLCGICGARKPEDKSSLPRSRVASGLADSGHIAYI